MANMQRLMEKLRSSPPVSIAGLPVVAVRDYGQLLQRNHDGSTAKLDAPKGNMLMMDLGLPGSHLPSGNAIAVRPSGTEPKIKFYLFGHEPLSISADNNQLATAQQTVRHRLDAMKQELASIAK